MVWNSYALPVKWQIGKTALENGSRNSQNFSIMLPSEPEILHLCIYPRQAKALGHENLDLNDQRTIQNSQKVETTQKSIER